MSHNTRVSADLGAWSAAVPVEPSEFYALDSACFEAINGDKGGIWTPSSVIKIGGAGLVLNGVHYIDIDSELRATYSGSRIWLANGGKLQVDAGGVIQVASGAGVVIDGQVGGNFEWGGSPRMVAGANLHVTAGADIEVDEGGDINVNHGGDFNVGVGGRINLLGAEVTIDATSTATIAGIASLSGSGRIRKRIIDGVDASRMYTADDADLVLVPNLTSNPTYTLGAGTNGDEIEFRKGENGGANINHILFVGTIFGATNWNLRLRNYEQGDVFAVRFAYRTGWHVTHLSVVPAP